MSRDYALSRVKDALEASKGNPAQATRLVMSWLENDQTLMIGLVAPHLKGIITHAVSYIERQDGPGAQKPAQNVPPESVLSDPVPEGDATGTSVLENLLGVGAKNGAGHQFGTLDQAPTKPGKTSAAHIDAIHKIARKLEEDE